MDLHTVKTNSSPEAFSNYLKEKGPIFWSPIERIWVVTDHELANSVLKSPDFSADRSSFFRSKMSGCPFSKVVNFFGVVTKMMVTSDAPEHTHRRRLASSGISDHVMDHFLPNVKSVVTELMANLKPDSPVDFVNQIAVPLPNILLADLFSIAAERRPDFYRWANHMTQFFGGASENILLDAENADTGAAELRDYFMQLMQERRQEPASDFISHLLNNQGSLEDSELVSQAAIMLVAGTVTTTDQICNNLYGILKSDMWERIVANPSLLDGAIEEATRLDPSVNFIFRVAKNDLTLGDVEIKAGQLAFVSSHAANRNEHVFTNPDSFALDRTKNPHLSYGTGAHYCLGARLGRAQMKELFSQLLVKFPRLSLDSTQEAKRKHQSLGFSGFDSLPLVLE
jgi:cytochrome P450